MPANTEKTSVPAGQSGPVVKVTFDEFGVMSSGFNRSGLLIEYIPLLARSVVSSHNSVPLKLQPGSSGKEAFSNESKYVAPGGTGAGAVGEMLVAGTDPGVGEFDTVESVVESVVEPVELPAVGGFVANGVG